MGGAEYAVHLLKLPEPTVARGDIRSRGSEEEEWVGTSAKPTTP